MQQTSQNTGFFLTIDCKTNKFNVYLMGNEMIVGSMLHSLFVSQGLQFFTANTPYTVTHDNLTATITLSHHIAKTKRKTKPGYDYRIVAAQLDCGGSATVSDFFRTKIRHNTEEAAILFFTAKHDKVLKIFIPSSTYGRDDVIRENMLFNLVHNNTENGTGRQEIIEFINSRNQISYCMIMPKFIGISLDKIIKNGAISSMRYIEKLNIAINCLKQIKKVHDKGYAHCDVKLENFIYNVGDHQVRIVDFGSAVRCDINSSAIRFSVTTLYITPHPSSPISNSGYLRDVYAVGVMLAIFFYEEHYCGYCEQFDITEFINEIRKKHPKFPEEITNLLYRIVGSNPALPPLSLDETIAAIDRVICNIATTSPCVTFYKPKL